MTCIMLTKVHGWDILGDFKHLTIPYPYIFLRDVVVRMLMMDYKIG